MCPEPLLLPVIRDFLYLCDHSMVSTLNIYTYLCFNTESEIVYHHFGNDFELFQPGEDFRLY